MDSTHINLSTLNTFRFLWYILIDVTYCFILTYAKVISDKYNILKIQVLLCFGCNNNYFYFQNVFGNYTHTILRCQT